MSGRVARTRLLAGRMLAVGENPDGAGSSGPWIVLALWTFGLAFCLAIAWAHA